MSNSCPVMVTMTGIHFVPASPTEDMFCLEDIAHALSMTCRYGGHTDFFYSVAEHSVRLAEAAQAEGQSVDVQLAALFHDAAEAYIGDVPMPIKVLLGDKIRELEDTFMSMIAKKFGITQLDHEWVKRADARIVGNEMRAFFPRNCPIGIPESLASVEIPVGPAWDSAHSEVLFILLANSLFEQRARSALN